MHWYHGLYTDPTPRAEGSSYHIFLLSRQAQSGVAIWVQLGQPTATSAWCLTALPTWAPPPTAAPGHQGSLGDGVGDCQCSRHQGAPCRNGPGHLPSPEGLVESVSKKGLGSHHEDVVGGGGIRVRGPGHLSGKASWRRCCRSGLRHALLLGGSCCGTPGEAFIPPAVELQLLHIFDGLGYGQ